MRVDRPADTSPENPVHGRFDIVLFWFMNDWGLYGRAYEKIAEHLAGLNDVRRVICILPPAWLWKGYCPFPFDIKTPREKLFVLTPNAWWIPARFPLSSVRRFVNDQFAPYVLARFLNAMTEGRRNTIFWVFPPHRYINDLLDLVPYRFLVTQIVDNNLYKERDPRERIEFVKSQYENLVRQSNVVITSSRMNHDHFRLMNPECHLFENALDPAFLGTPTGFPCRRSGTRPRLGYVGWITQRTDLDLLRFIAGSRPDCDLVLAGPIDVPVQDFANLLLPNVRYEGVVPYSRMPEYLRSLDVCLIAHRDTLYSRSMSPLKLFQYLGSGRPVVSTRVAGAERWEELIAVAEDPSGFLEKIDEILRNDTVDSSRRRIEAVRKETWEHRVRDMFDAVIRAVEIDPVPPVSIDPT